ncbi:hypothetical protein [Lentzea cavernae]|uniref:Secreted protein n=1 Tax=Lentzea cavernae TaxID=2020703 RepID=A0ABQ3M9D6_9PSEU|nr:hypothetical protein [Lentzea cavernae]GHH36964.1 hypothetical protein GCM10017774_24950 [Lentzea cavernae]
MRKFVLALSMAFLAVMGSLAPASAEVTSVQAVSEIGAAADGIEFAVAGTLPPRSQLTCHSYTAVEICYEKGGDHWWVQDQDSDGASAGVYWENIRNGSLYRNGTCITSLGKGSWGQCNKNYYEDSVLNGWPCTWDRGAGGDIECTGPGYRYQ